MIMTTLSCHILHYCAERLADDDLDALIDLGLGTDEITALDGLTLQQLTHLGRLGQHIFKVSTDHSRLASALQYVENEASQRKLQDQLLQHRAPAPLMQALFGIRSGEYAKRRKRLGLSGRDVGRPPAPDEKTEHRVWRLWQKHAELDDGERYLQIAELTQLPLTIIWTVIQSDPATISTPRQGAKHKATAYQPSDSDITVVANAR